MADDSDNHWWSESQLVYGVVGENVKSLKGKRPTVVAEVEIKYAK